jgi:Leucine-rich repeat (LRR) protein
MKIFPLFKMLISLMVFWIILPLPALCLEQGEEDAYPSQALSIPHFPDEIQLHVFSFLSLSDSARASQVCKEWSLLTQDHSLLRTLTLPDYLSPVKKTRAFLSKEKENIKEALRWGLKEEWDRVEALYKKITLDFSLPTAYLGHEKLWALPPDFINLTGATELKFLDLAFNSLTRLCPRLKELKQLETLKLNANPLSQLPEEIWELSSLKELNLDGTLISILPAEIKNLTNLERLSLYNCPHLKTLPPELGHLPLLNILWIKASLDETIPPSLLEKKEAGTLEIKRRSLTLKEFNVLSNATSPYPSVNFFFNWQIPL